MRAESKDAPSARNCISLLAILDSRNFEMMGAKPLASNDRTSVSFSLEKETTLFVILITAFCRRAIYKIPSWRVGCATCKTYAV